MTTVPQQENPYAVHPNSSTAYTLTSRQSRWMLMIGLILATFALRLYRLDHFSLRGDEAFDVLFASQPLGELLYQFRFVQPYPPIFHTGLHFWLPVAGESELAVRFWAVLCSTLAVPAVYALGLQLFNRRVGLVGALLAAVNPFIHWWGQDAHFYGYLLALTTLLNVVALRFWRSDARNPNREKGNRHRLLIEKPDRIRSLNGFFISALYVLVALISFLTHYFAYFAWGALNVVAAFQTLRRRWSRPLIRRWWSAQIVLVALYLPWVIPTLPVASTYVEAWIDRATPWDMLWRELVAFSLGYTSFPITPWLAGFCAVLFVLGITLGWQHPAHRPGLILTLALIFVPLAIIYLASFHRPIFDEKLTIFLLPFYLVVLSLGIVKLAERWHRAGYLLGLVVVLIMSFANYQYFTNEKLAKSPAWREMIGFVHQKAQPGDVYIYNFPEPSILHYNDGKLPIELIPDAAKLSTDQISAQLEEAIAGYARVWLTPLVRPWWDTRGDVVTWLDRHADRLDQRFFRGVHVNLYLTPSAWGAAMTPQPVTFAEGLRLRGFRMSGGDEGPQSLILSPGDTLYLSLYWQTEGPTQLPYTVFTHLIGPNGQLYGQWDNPPVRGTYPTTEWSPGESVVDQYEIVVSSDAPPGDYHLLAGLYDPGTGTRLPVLTDNRQTRGDSVRLNQTISVQAR